MKKETKIPNFLQSKHEDDRPIPELYDNLYLSEDSPNEAFSGHHASKNNEKTNKSVKKKANDSIF